MHNAAFARYEDNPARQLAYQTWAIDPTRPLTDVIPEIEAAVGQKLATRTVYDWRRRDQWERRYAEEEAAQSGLLVVRHVRGLRVAAPSSVDYLSAVARGEEPYDRGRVEVSKFLVTEAGRFLALLPQTQTGVPTLALPDLESLSDEELYQLETQTHQSTNE